MATLATDLTNEAAGQGDGPRALFGLAARRLAQLAVVTAVVLGLAMPPSIPRWYFFHQDVALLAVQLLALWWFAQAATTRAADVPALTGRQAAALIGLAAAVAYAGTWLVLERFALSRDEQLAEFAAAHLQHGQLARPVPPALQPLGEALMPLWADSILPSGWWLSNYLPINSVLRALAGLAGDRWLAGPALLAVGAAATFGVARRLWPDRPAASTVTLVLLLTSAQALIMAMSPFAMTAHLALNAAWLWCFVRGGRWHGVAMAIGVAATGLHQVQFHLIFVSGFLLWSWLRGRRALTVAYLLSLGMAVAFWRAGYPRLVHDLLGIAPSGPGAPAVLGGWTVALFGRLSAWQPLNSLARFAAWQNALLLPLAWVGARASRDTHGRPTLIWAMRLSCGLGLLTMIYQGQGFGYRYLHGLLPCFCLLAAQGWIVLSERGLGRPVLWASVAVALCVTTPAAAWMSQRLLHPYAAAYRLAKAAPADVVLVDARGVAFAQDLIRLDDTLSRPLLLDLAVLPGDALVDLCRRRRVMILDQRQLKPLGLLPPMGIEEPAYAFASRRALLAKLRCGTPVPM